MPANSMLSAVITITIASRVLLTAGSRTSGIETGRRGTVSVPAVIA